MVVMRLIWAAGKKSDLALPMRAQHSDHRVAHLYRGCCKGFPGWEGVSGRWSDPKRRGKPPSSWCSRERQRSRSHTSRRTITSGAAMVEIGGLPSDWMDDRAVMLPSAAAVAEANRRLDNRRPPGAESPQITSLRKKARPQLTKRFGNCETDNASLKIHEGSLGWKLSE